MSVTFSLTDQSRSTVQSEACGSKHALSMNIRRFKLSQLQPRGWMPEQLTIPWGPLSVWRNPYDIAYVDATRVSFAALLRDYISQGRPVVLRNAMLATISSPQCQKAFRM